MFEYNGVKFIGHKNWTKKELNLDFTKIANRLHWFNLVDNYNYDDFYKTAESAYEVLDIYRIDGKEIQIVPVANSFTYLIKQNGAADLISIK